MAPYIFYDNFGSENIAKVQNNYSEKGEEIRSLWIYILPQIPAENIFKEGLMMFSEGPRNSNCLETNLVLVSTCVGD